MQSEVRVCAFLTQIFDTRCPAFVVRVTLKIKADKVHRVLV